MNDYPPFRGQVGHPEGLTLDSCGRLGLTIAGICATHGERAIVPDPRRHRPIWTRRLKLLFDDGKLVCADCREPFGALKIGRAGTATVGPSPFVEWRQAETTKAPSAGEG